MPSRKTRKRKSPDKRSKRIDPKRKKDDPKDAVSLDLDLDFMCCVCRDFPRTPHIFQCANGHLCCSECYEVIESGTRAKQKCPVCRIAYGHPGVRSRVAEKVIAAKGPICCTLGCHGMVPILNMKEHVEKHCPLISKPCKFKLFGCHREAPQSQILAHQKKCPIRKLPMDEFLKRAKKNIAKHDPYKILVEKIASTAVVEKSCVKFSRMRARSANTSTWFYPFRAFGKHKINFKLVVTRDPLDGNKVSASIVSEFPDLADPVTNDFKFFSISFLETKSRKSFGFVPVTFKQKLKSVVKLSTPKPLDILLDDYMEPLSFQIYVFDEKVTDEEGAVDNFDGESDFSSDSAPEDNSLIQR